MSIKTRPGINVFGHLRSSAGLGNTTKVFIDLLQKHGYEVAGFDVDYYPKAVVSDLEPAMNFKNSGDLPFDNSIVISTLNRVPKIWLRHSRRLMAPSSKVAGLIFWELPVIPSAWVPSLKMFDVLLSPSQYVRQAIEGVIHDVPTLHAEHPMSGIDESDSTSVRAKYGIPSTATVFCCSFDPRSGFARKNPTGAIQAWLNAFPTSQDVRLVIKSNGSPPLDNAAFAETVRRCAEDSRVIWVHESLNHKEVMNLFSACDIFVSLHRSEGLGLVPMEAMSLGKVAIATGYSGNLTYMNEQNSLLVPYRLIVPHDEANFMTHRFAGAGAVWADPDLEQAAVKMRYAAEHPKEMHALGTRARSDIAARQVTAWDGKCLDEMFRLMGASDRHRLRGALRARLIVQEFTNSTLIGRNIRAFSRRISERSKQ